MKDYLDIKNKVLKKLNYVLDTRNNSKAFYINDEADFQLMKEYWSLALAPCSCGSLAPLVVEVEGNFTGTDWYFLEEDSVSGSRTRYWLESLSMKKRKFFMWCDSFERMEKDSVWCRSFEEKGKDENE